MSGTTELNRCARLANSCAAYTQVAKIVPRGSEETSYNLNMIGNDKSWTVEHRHWERSLHVVSGNSRAAFDMTSPASAPN
jgi:hypothetical protein